MAEGGNPLNAMGEAVQRIDKVGDAKRFYDAFVRVTDREIRTAYRGDDDTGLPAPARDLLSAGSITLEDISEIVATGQIDYALAMDGANKEVWDRVLPAKYRGQIEKLMF